MFDKKQYIKSSWLATLLQLIYGEPEKGEMKNRLTLAMPFHMYYVHRLLRMHSPMSTHEEAILQQPFVTMRYSAMWWVFLLLYTPASSPTRFSGWLTQRPRLGISNLFATILCLGNLDYWLGNSKRVATMVN
ncbi:hypothetical protein R6Q59_024740 [Mikania micrantha]